MEALGGLLVNPGGERFLAFMQQFATLVMYTVAKNNQGIAISDARSI